MLIRCEERYQEALEHAVKTDNNTLQKCLERLKKWEANLNAKITLYYDHAPLSFYFEMKNKDGQRVMNGGLLYHGNPDESCAVTFDTAKGWQIYT